ncbi:hypothetical protein HDU88_003613 [Geranomyces variabilis]|nr:hypothetical protein HDU88_003613 [Geranomyces variabilis]
MNDALISFLLKASVRGCGGGRNTVTLYTIFILDEPCALPTKPGVRRRNNELKTSLPDIAGCNAYRGSPKLQGRLVKRVNRVPSINDNRAKKRKIEKPGDPIMPAYTLRPSVPGSSGGGPIFDPKLCPAYSKIDFVLRVPDGLKTLLGLLHENRSPHFVVDAVSSPTLLRSPYFNWRDDNTARDRIEYKSLWKGNVNGQDVHDYTLTYVPQAPIRGHVIVFFQVQTVGPLQSEHLFDVSFVCGSTGSGMDAKLPKDTDAAKSVSEPTIPLMVWNVNQLGNVAGKADYLKYYAKQFEVGIWIEAKTTVFEQLKNVAGTDYQIQAVRPWDSSKTQDEKRKNVNLDFVITLNSKKYKFGSTQCIKLPSAPELRIPRPSGALLARAPCATLITSVGDEGFFIIPVHWPSVLTWQARRIETERLIMYMEFIRVRSGLRVVVAGDFNTEWDSLMYKSPDAKPKNPWVTAQMQWGAREIPTTLKKTKMHHVPKEGEKVSDDTRSFDFTLVSHNIQHFSWEADNPFNDPESARRRSSVLQKYLHQFKVIALQEVSINVADVPEGPGDDPYTDESEDDRESDYGEGGSDYGDSDNEDNEEEDEAEDETDPTPLPLVHGQICEQPIKNMNPKDPHSPLSPDGNLVMMKGFGQDSHCETVILYPKGQWDMKICRNTGFGDDIGCLAQGSQLFLPGIDDTLPNPKQTKVANNICGTLPPESKTPFSEWTTTSVAYYRPQLDESGNRVGPGANKVDIVVKANRAKIDQWLVGFADDDDCSDRKDHDFAGPFDGSGCNEGSSPPAALDTYSDHRPVYVGPILGDENAMDIDQ